ncbi:MAG: heavy-metal-associated domain-containing protein [Nanoarchaeota archaeon]
MKTNLNIKGMHCKSCVKLIESELQDKVNTIQVQENGNAIIDFDEKKISLQKIKDILKELGYSA